jgi:hypothetical protein
VKEDAGSGVAMMERSTNVGLESAYLSFNDTWSIVVHVYNVTPRIKSKNRQLILLESEPTMSGAGRGVRVFGKLKFKAMVSEWRKIVKNLNEKATVKTHRQVEDSRCVCASFKERKATVSAQRQGMLVRTSAVHQTLQAQTQVCAQCAEQCARLHICALLASGTDNMRIGSHLLSAKCKPNARVDDQNVMQNIKEKCDRD